MNCLPIFIVLSIFCVSVLGQGREHMRCLEVMDKNFSEYKNKNPNDSISVDYKPAENNQCSVTCGLRVSKQGEDKFKVINQRTVPVPDYQYCGNGTSQRCINGKCVDKKETQMHKFCAEKWKKEREENKHREIFFQRSGCNFVLCNNTRFPTPTHNFNNYELCQGINKKGVPEFCKQGKCVLPNGKIPTRPDEE